MGDVINETVPDHIHDAANKANEDLGQSPRGRKLLSSKSGSRVLATYERAALSYYDGLTGIPNRDGIIEKFKFAQAVENRAQVPDKPYAIMALDLVGLKRLNDSLGHHGADEVLKTAARYLRQTCRMSDIVGRYTGDEFIVVLLDTDLSGVQTLIDKINGNTPDKVMFNLGFEIFDDKKQFEANLDLMIDNVDRFKNGPKDLTGRLIKGGIARLSELERQS